MLSFFQKQKPKEKTPPMKLKDFIIKTRQVRLGVWRDNPRKDQKRGYTGLPSEKDWEEFDTYEKKIKKRLAQLKQNPRLKGYQKVYVIRTKSGIPLGAYGGLELTKKYAQKWADRTNEQIAIDIMTVPKK